MQEATPDGWEEAPLTGHWLRSGRVYDAALVFEEKSTGTFGYSVWCEMAGHVREKRGLASLQEAATAAATTQDSYYKSLDCDPKGTEWWDWTDHNPNRVLSDFGL
jgi:hypothetical protein